jgi:hypothetical protein
MNAIEVAQNNFNSWNRHGADAFVAAYAKGGIYRTPRAGHDLTGHAIGELVKSVWTAFPDASLELISIGDTGGSLVAIQWMLHGTHTGPFMDGTRLPVAPSPIQGLPSFRLRAIRFARSTSTLTGKRWLSNWGSKPSKPEALLEDLPACRDA